eukprot:COSAG01_NODE_330_length_18723_cov_96.763155_1_plen_369_part_10
MCILFICFILFFLLFFCLAFAFCLYTARSNGKKHQNFDSSRKQRVQKISFQNSWPQYNKQVSEVNLDFNESVVISNLNPASKHYILAGFPHADQGVGLVKIIQMRNNFCLFENNMFKISAPPNSLLFGKKVAMNKNFVASIDTESFYLYKYTHSGQKFKHELEFSNNLPEYENKLLKYFLNFSQNTFVILSENGHGFAIYLNKRQKHCTQFHLKNVKKVLAVEFGDENTLIVASNDDTLFFYHFERQYTSKEISISLINTKRFDNTISDLSLSPMENCIVVGSAATGHLKCLTKYEKEENWRVFQEILPEFSEEGSQFAYRIALSSDGCKLVVASRGKGRVYTVQNYDQPFFKANRPDEVWSLNIAGTR